MLAAGSWVWLAKRNKKKIKDKKKAKEFLLGTQDRGVAVPKR